MSPGLTSAALPGGANSLSGDAALGLQADIDEGVVVLDADDAALDDGMPRSCRGAEAFIEEGGEAFVWAPAAPSEAVSVAIWSFSSSNHPLHVFRPAGWVRRSVGMRGHGAAAVIRRRTALTARRSALSG